MLTPSDAHAPGFEGLSGVIAASVYAFLAFIGFEAAAPLAAETKNPKRNVPRAIVGAALIVGVFFCSPHTLPPSSSGPRSFLDFNGGNGWIGIARGLWKAGWIVLLITLMNSCLACASGGAMAATRAVWAMGHHRTIPKVFARTHPRWRSPVYALYLVFGLAGTFTFVVSAIWGPVTGFLLFGSMLTIAVLPIYIIAALACPLYYFRYRRSELNIVPHLIVPVLAVGFLAPVFFAGAGIPVFSFVAPLTYPSTSPVPSWPSGTSSELASCSTY